MTDSTNLIRLVKEIEPDEIYNLAAMSHVKVSFEVPEYVADADGIGTLRLLEAIKFLGFEKRQKYIKHLLQNYMVRFKRFLKQEKLLFIQGLLTQLRNYMPIGLTKNYREAYDLFCNGILFNHESPLRGETFVTRKITMAVARIALGLQDKLYLGNLDAKRDWEHAKDYVEMMWMILQADNAEDWVIATGKTTSIRDFVVMAFNEVGVELEFTGSGINEKATVVECSNPDYSLEIGTEVVGVDTRYFRPTEVDLLIGGHQKQRKSLDGNQK